MSVCFACGHDMLDVIRPAKTIQVVGCNNCLNVSKVEWQGDTLDVDPILAFQPIQDLIPDESVMAKVLEAIPQAITHLPVLDEVPQKVVTMIHDPATSINDVVKVIEEDLALSTKILSMANSAFYATVSEIVDLPTACSRLGVRSISNIANAMACANQYKSKDPAARRFMQSL